MEYSLTPKQIKNFEARKKLYDNTEVPKKKHTLKEKVLLVLAERPHDWFYTWELIGNTKYGFLSHATHATLRVLQQEGLIHKAYIGKYVIYTHINNFA